MLLTTECFCLLRLAHFSPFRLTSLEGSVGGIDLSSLSTGVCWNKCGFDEFVQFIQVDIGEQRAEYSPLWAATVGSMIAPLLPRIQL